MALRVKLGLLELGLNRFSSDFLRLISICAVLVIHSTGEFERSFASSHRFFSAEFVGIVLNQLARFSVPVFIMLSGFALSLRYKGDLDVREFFVRRASKIGIPFLAWTPVFLLAHQIGQHPDLMVSASGWPDALVSALGELPAALFTYGADYHFYFFIIILQCYLLFPLLLRASGKVWWILIPLHLITHAPAHLLLDQIGVHLPRFPSSFFVYWILYFFAGIRFARNAKQVHPAVALLFFIPVILEFMFYSTRDTETGNYDHFTRWTVTLFAFAVFCAAHWLAKFENRAAEIVTKGAGISFAVYIIHTTVLRILSMTPLSGNLLIIPALIAVTFSFCAFLDRVIGVSWLRTVFGLPEKMIPKGATQ